MSMLRLFKNVPCLGTGTCSGRPCLVPTTTIVAAVLVGELDTPDGCDLGDDQVVGPDFEDEILKCNHGSEQQWQGLILAHVNSALATMYSIVAN